MENQKLEYDYPLLNELKARTFDELAEYAVDDNCDPKQLRDMVMNFSNVVSMVREMGVAQ